VATIAFELDGRPVEAPDLGTNLLVALREHLGVRSVKDGCSPQGQCGCCTVLVDGAPRVACVTPLRRVAGRSVTTVDGLAPETRDGWAEAFCAHGASQCGFCTPGIIVRLEGLRAKRGDRLDEVAVERALAAHLCRCTGWRTIVDAALGRPIAVAGRRDLEAAGRRASIEGGTPQGVDPEIALGRAGFADDIAPDDALVALPGPAGGWVVAESLLEAQEAAGKVQGRRTTLPVTWPVEVPTGDWEATLRTTWVEPGYLEPDASWCVPGGTPATPLANGGAFGGKVESEVGAVARRLADEHGRPVRVLLPREATVRNGPKRPPVAGGIRADGTGELRVVRTPGIVEAIAAVAPDFAVTEVDVPGPPTSASIRAAGWAEAVLLGSALSDEGSVEVVDPTGGRAVAEIVDGRIRVEVACGAALDEVVVRSYVIGAAHQALGWVTSEALTVDADGAIHDLTVRSFGIVRPADMWPVDVVVDADDDREPVRAGDATFVAVAAALWRMGGCRPSLPTELELP
jgi:aerobic-type carbon monoxide dehydrogenase small subunit (CoxS/CutS family)